MGRRLAKEIECRHTEVFSVSLPAKFSTVFSEVGGHVRRRVSKNCFKLEGFVGVYLILGTTKVLRESGTSEILICPSWKSFISGSCVESLTSLASRWPSPESDLRQKSSEQYHLAFLRANLPELLELLQDSAYLLSEESVAALDFVFTAFRKSARHSVLSLALSDPLQSGYSQVRSGCGYFRSCGIVLMGPGRSTVVIHNCNAFFISETFANFHLDSL